MLDYHDTSVAISTSWLSGSHSRHYYADSHATSQAYDPGRLRAADSGAHRSFLTCPLSSADAEPDFEAWSTSIEHLQGIFGPESNWPTTEMTLEENSIDLAWHQREHESASSFAFTVFDINDARCLGCVYLSPARKVGYEVEVFYWVRASEVSSGLDQTLGTYVHQWLQDVWKFDSVVFPGRDVAWDDYMQLSYQSHW